jgi:hypothetical protein
MHRYHVDRLAEADALLFGRVTSIDLKLVSRHAFGSGAVALRYVPRR